jgi:choline dehydrogenase-like flavoprotein
MAGDAVIVGSGAAGSVVAWELARAGWSVTVLERGRNLRPGFGEVDSHELDTHYGSDEIKTNRELGFPDGLLEPYTTRTRDEAADGVARSATGALGQLGAAVGGTTLHYNAKTPRFFRQDFTQLSDLGPVEGAQVADWPITYDDLAPYYDEVEQRIGVQGDVEQMPVRTLEQSPRSGQFVMPPNPTGYAAQLLAEGARRVGMEPFPYPSAVNSQEFEGRPACNSCGMCSGFGCPINARGDALVSWLNPAVRTGRVRVIERAFVHRIDTTPDGRRATRVRYLDAEGRERTIGGELIVLAGSPINTARLLLLSASDAHPDGLGNRSDQVGRNMMFHNFTQGASVYPHDVQPLRAQSTTLQIDDLIGPFAGPEIEDAGLPYIKGGLIQVGGAAPLLQGGLILAGFTGFGHVHKQLMRVGPLHSRVAATQLVHEDLPQADNRIDLDPDVRDVHGLPAARITYSPHRHEQVAALVLGARLEAMHAAAPGAIGAAIIPYPIIEPGATYTAHLAGTARMGDDPATSVCGADGRLHEVENVVVADGSTFPTFPGFNPTLTIMANALRIARGITEPDGPRDEGRRARPDHAQAPPPAAGDGPVLPATGGGGPQALLPVIATAAAAATARGARGRVGDGPPDDGPHHEDPPHDGPQDDGPRSTDPLLTDDHGAC